MSTVCGIAVRSMWMEVENARRITTAMRSRISTLVVVLLVVLLAATAYHHRYGIMARLHILRNIKPVGRTILEPGQHLPAMQMTELGGQQITLTPKPGHILYLNVFATWCPDCQKETPALEQFAQETRRMAVDVIGIDQQEALEPVNAFVQTYGLTYPIVIDELGLTQRLMGVRYIPTSFIVDSHGIVRTRITGALTLAQMESTLGGVLKGRKVARN